MKLNSILHRSKEFLSQQMSFFFYKSRKTDEGKPIVFLNLRKPHLFNRYLYTFVKFLHLEGYQIWFPNDFEIFRKINAADIYLRLILDEKIVHFKNPKVSEVFLEINKSNLSADYYSNIHKLKKENGFIIPMTLHPIFYNSGIWSKNITQKNRKHSVFMSGNFEETSYKTIERSYFKVNSRIEIFEYLQENKLLMNCSSKSILLNFLAKKEDNKCIIIRRKDFSIPVEELREILASFHFYLACPGVVIPNAHNIIEAMSVGCIPLIQENYARFMQPPLENGKNAIIFKDLDDLPVRIESCYNSPASLLNSMHKNVYAYYEDHLTPKAVISKIEKNRYKRFYLQAEFESAKLLRYNTILQNLNS